MLHISAQSSTHIRILLADDYQPWLQTLRLMLSAREELRIVAEVGDGLEAVQNAQELLPDLILLDIGLPRLDGIEAAKRIAQVAPQAKILFVTQNGDVEVVRMALRNGATGYVLKADAGAELLEAIETVIKGKRFVSTRVKS